MKLLITPHQCLCEGAMAWGGDIKRFLGEMRQLTACLNTAGFKMEHGCHRHKLVC